MLSEQEITEWAESHIYTHTVSYCEGLEVGARWANERNREEIAELVEALQKIANIGDSDIAPLTRDERISRLQEIETIAKSALEKHGQ